MSMAKNRTETGERTPATKRVVRFDSSAADAALGGYGLVSIYPTTNMAMPQQCWYIEGGTGQPAVPPSVACAYQTLANYDLQFATKQKSSPQAVGGKPKRQTTQLSRTRITRPAAVVGLGYSLQRPTPQITKAAASVKRVAVGAVAGVNGRTGFATSPAFSAPGSRHCGLAARSPRLNHCTRRNRDNCSSFVIRFLSRPNAAATKTHKNPSFSTFTAARRPETKGNIAPFKPFTFQENLEEQAVFAISRTVATEKTGQTKHIRYPVFIRNRRPRYHNN